MSTDNTENSKAQEVRRLIRELSPLWRSEEAKRIMAKYSDDKPYRQEDLEKISYTGLDLALKGRSAVVVKTEERPHHPFSPSTLQSLEACPCYQSKQSDTPHPRTVIGTISHGVTETGEDDPRLSDEDSEKVAECIDFYEQRKQALPGAEELKETYLPIDDETFPDGAIATTAGYIDCALVRDNYAEIFDWKFGFWPVEHAENNLQGIAYALGMFKRFPELQTVRYFFKQPNLEYITSATITRAAIPEFYLRIQVVVAKARAARAAGDFVAARPHVPACNFCANLAVCPAVTAFACRVGHKFSPIDIPPDITPTMVHNAADTKLGLQLAEVLAVWSKAFKGVITNRVICQDAPPPDGYKLESRQPREILDANKYKEIALKYLTPEEYESTLKAAFGSVEDKIKDKAPRGQKESTVKQFKDDCETAGAVAKKDPYTFLRAVPQKPNQ